MAKRKPTNEIKIHRIYNAPVKLVWEAWTDLKHVGKWWGPRGFTLTTHSKDLRPGGKWIYTMHGPDGVDYPNMTTYYEVETYKKLVYDHGASEGRPPLFRVTVKFEERKGQTHMDMTMTLESIEAAENIRVFIKQAGGNSTWDRLAEYLQVQESKNEIFVINRSFEINVDKMWELWTDPSHFSKWLPPTGFRMEFLRKNLSVGGTSFYKMTNDANVTMYGLIKYLEFQKPHKIVYTQQFADQNEKISRHPMAPIWPETMLTTVELVSEEEDCTRVTITWEIYGSATAEEMAAFVQAKPGMTLGWTGSLDKLEDLCG